MPKTTTVLVCDDSRTMRMVTRSLLEASGYKVVGEAVDGFGALEQYQKLNPDIVMLDLVMPERNGEQALQDILGYDPDASVVILSSLGSEDDIENALKTGAKSFLQKPVDPEVMNRILQQVSG